MNQRQKNKRRRLQNAYEWICSQEERDIDRCIATLKQNHPELAKGKDGAHSRKEKK